MRVARDCFAAQIIGGPSNHVCAVLSFIVVALAAHGAIFAQASGNLDGAAAESAPAWGQIPPAAFEPAPDLDEFAPPDDLGIHFLQRRIWGGHFFHRDVDDPGRYLGLGDPLVGTSWRNRPFHVGWMYGELFGDDLIRGRVEQHQDMLGGYRLGWDFDHYWGLEGRFVFSNVEFSNTLDPTISSTSQNHFWDVDLVYYPWGDARWRPYGSLGIGWANFDFQAVQGGPIDKSLVTFPFGGGVKYYWKNWLALRLSAIDNWAIGQGPLSTMHNVSLTGDIEFHFGGRRTSYFPYHGGLHLW